MATSETTPGGSNFLGHPCAIAPVLHHYADSRQASRREYQDPRYLAQWLAQKLRELMIRVDNAHEAANLLRAQHGNGDEEQLLALLDMHADYTLKTSRDGYALAGMVLDLMERADMVTPAQMVESAHG